jgi:hypothetical protein
MTVARQLVATLRTLDALSGVLRKLGPGTAATVWRANERLRA